MLSERRGLLSHTSDRKPFRWLRRRKHISTKKRKSKWAALRHLRWHSGRTEAVIAWSITVQPIMHPKEPSGQNMAVGTEYITTEDRRRHMRTEGDTRGHRQRDKRQPPLKVKDYLSLWSKDQTFHSVPQSSWPTRLTGDQMAKTNTASTLKTPVISLTAWDHCCTQCLFGVQVSGTEWSTNVLPRKPVPPTSWKEMDTGPGILVLHVCQRWTVQS